MCGQSGFLVLIHHQQRGSGSSSIEECFSAAIESAVAAVAQTKESEVQAAAPADRRREITALYEKHNPKRLPDLPRLFAEWEGREDALLSAVLFKYEDLEGPAPVPASGCFGCWSRRGRGRGGRVGPRPQANGDHSAA
jgi:hypothetical protein